MGLGDCTKCVKYLLFVFNLIFCLVGLAILAVGIVVYVYPNHLKDAADVDLLRHVLQMSAIVIIVIGSIITVLGFLGCCGAIFENRVLLVLFFILLLLVFLCVLAIGIAFAVYSDTYHKNAVGGFFADARGKPANSSERAVVDEYQKLWSCCGWNNDDTGSTNITPPPSSCHLNYTSSPPVSCSQRHDETIGRYRVPTLVAIFVTAAISLLGVIFSMVLCCAITDLA